MTQVTSKRMGLCYVPEHWGTLDRFMKFHHTTYQFEWSVQRRLTGIRGNLDKAYRLRQVINDLLPRLEEDEKQLRETGHTPAHGSREIAAVVEGTFCGLYTVLDCFRVVFKAIYPRGIKDSTRGLFQKGHKGELDERIPEPIREGIKQTKPWFDELRKLRDEMTHSDVGTCSRDKETGKLFYMHSGLGSPQRAGIIDDVLAKLDEFRDRINEFLGLMFHELIPTLKDEETQQVCGFYDGRIYERMVKPSEATDFHGGRCKSHAWFDKEGSTPCPLRDKCGAYARVKSEG